MKAKTKNQTDACGSGRRQSVRFGGVSVHPVGCLAAVAQKRFRPLCAMRNAQVETIIYIKSWDAFQKPPSKSRPKVKARCTHCPLSVCRLYPEPPATLERVPNDGCKPRVS